jgi:hypothetical protein
MSFFRALFDFSFSEFVTTKIIKILYVIVIIMWALTWFFALIASFFSKSALQIVLSIIICPIAFILCVTFSRVGYEILIVVFQIAENVRDFTYFTTRGQKAPAMGAPVQPQYPQAYQQQAYPQQQQPPAATPPQYPQYPQYPPQQQPPQYPPRP